MKRIVLILLSICAFASCSQEDEKEKTSAAGTSLELTLKDEDGNVMTEGIGYALLYGTVEDWSYGLHQIGEPKFANAAGKITFDNLTPQKYYWRVENGCRNNFTTSITTPSPLVANVNNEVIVPMTTSFSLRLQKNSAYEGSAFNIFINSGSAIAIPEGLDERTILSLPPHSSVRVVQTSGFSGEPIDVTYSDLSAECGQTLTLNYPE